jgi:hypothetical protein
MDLIVHIDFNFVNLDKAMDELTPISSYLRSRNILMATLDQFVMQLYYTNIPKETIRNFCFSKSGYNFYIVYIIKELKL